MKYMIFMNYYCMDDPIICVIMPKAVTTSRVTLIKRLFAKYDFKCVANFEGDKVSFKAKITKIDFTEWSVFKAKVNKLMEVEVK